MLRNDRLSTIVFSSQKTLVNAKSHRYISLSSSSSFFYHHLSPSTTIPHFLREFCRRWYLLLIYINVLYCFCYLSTPSSAESSTSSASEDFLVVQQKTRHQLPLSDIVNNSSSPALVGFGQTSHHIVLTDLSQPIIPQVTPPHDQKQQELLLPPPPLNFLSRNTPATTESLHLITTNSSSDTTCEKTCRAMMASTLRVEPPTYDVHRVRWKSPLGLWYCVLSVLLILFAGLASGLTLGLMSLDPVQLKVLGLEGTEEEKKGVQLVSKVIRRHHLLLVTLLLTNSIALETLPIFLDRLVPSWAAIALSVTGILLFGEIIPQAVCTGRRQLAIAQVCCCYIPFGTHSHAVPLISQTAAPYVNILIGLFFIISWPIATLLDYLVGDTEHHSYYARAHLKALIRMHEKDRRMADGTVTGGRCDSSSALGSDEVVVIEGALDLAEKTVKQIMLPIQDVFMLSSDTIMDQQSSNIVLSTGHSRVPVYSGNRNNIKGLLLTKSLLAVDSSAGITAGQLIVQRRSIFVSPNCNLYHILNEFQKGHSHIAFVTMQPEEYSYALKMTVDVNPSASLMGIVTLEDVIEELIQEEIYDEFDQTGGGLGISKPNGLLVESGALPLGYADAWYFTDINATGDSGYGRKYSSSALHTLNKTLTSEPKRASSFARDLPQVVQQLAPDVSRLTKCSGSRKYPPSCTNNPLLASMTLPLVISMDSPPIHESRKSSDTLHRMTSSPTNLIGNDYSNYSPKKKKKISTDCPNITIPVASEAEDPHIISTSNHMINGDVEYQSNPLSVKYHTANENQGLDPTTDIPETLLSTWDPNPSLQTDIFSWDTAANNPASDLLQQSLIEPTTTNPVLTSDNPTKFQILYYHKEDILGEYTVDLTPIYDSKDGMAAKLKLKKNTGFLNVTVRHITIATGIERCLTYAETDTNSTGWSESSFCKKPKAFHVFIPSSQFKRLMSRYKDSPFQQRIQLGEFSLAAPPSQVVHHGHPTFGTLFSFIYNNETSAKFDIYKLPLFETDQRGMNTPILSFQMSIQFGSKLRNQNVVIMKSGNCKQTLTLLKASIHFSSISINQCQIKHNASYMDFYHLDKTKPLQLSDVQNSSDPDWCYRQYNDIFQATPKFHIIPLEEQECFPSGLLRCTIYNVSFSKIPTGRLCVRMMYGNLEPCTPMATSSQDVSFNTAFLLKSPAGRYLHIKVLFLDDNWPFETLGACACACVKRCAIVDLKNFIEATVNVYEGSWTGPIISSAYVDAGRAVIAYRLEKSSS